MLYQAHRSVCTNYPENTMPAFIAAKEQGYHIIECDPRFTKDGQCVIHHDATINRTCRTTSGDVIQEPLAIDQLTYDELLHYDAGIWKGDKFRGTKVPLLKEVLAFSQDANIPIKLDNLFSRFPADFQSVIFDEVSASGADVGFTCADIKTVQTVVDLFPDADIHYDGPVTEDTVHVMKDILRDNQLTIWLPLDTPQTAWSKLPKADSTLCKMVKRNARLGLWLLKTNEELLEALELAADIIETDGSLKPQDLDSHPYIL